MNQVGPGPATANPQVRSGNPQSGGPPNPGNPQSGGYVGGPPNAGYMPPGYMQRINAPPLPQMPTAINPFGNPCECCCDLVIAAKMLATVNLIFLFYALLITLPGPDKMLGYWRDGWVDVSYVRELHIATLVSVALYLPLTILFLISTVALEKVELKIRFSNLYMLVNLCCPTLIFQFINAAFKLGPEFDIKFFFMWTSWTIYWAVIFIWAMFNGSVAMSYRNYLQGKPNLPEGIEPYRAVAIEQQACQESSLPCPFNFFGVVTGFKILVCLNLTFLMFNQFWLSQELIEWSGEMGKANWYWVNGMIYCPNPYTTTVVAVAFTVLDAILFPKARRLDYEIRMCLTPVGYPYGDIAIYIGLIISLDITLAVFACVICNLSKNTQLFFCKIYWWLNICHPLWIGLIIRMCCNSYYYGCYGAGFIMWIFHFCLMAYWLYISIMVTNAYIKALEGSRGSASSGQPEQIPPSPSMAARPGGMPNEAKSTVSVAGGTNVGAPSN